MEHDLSDRRFDLILERLDRIADELAKTNKSLDNDENFIRLARELATLNESLQALAYAALGRRRRRCGAATLPRGGARCRARRSSSGCSRLPRAAPRDRR